MHKIARDETEHRYLREVACKALGIDFPQDTPRTVVQKREKQRPANALSSLRRDPDADFSLYYIRVLYNGRRFYKIGVTTSNILIRFREDFSKIDKILYCEKVVGALDAERSVLSTFKEHLFPLAIFKSGATEFFDKDVLGLDK